eukprot:Amastigsp_a5197_24.p3 type:complete len:102 gc:universal Amastigsp_a5197_24:547-242(-)
MPQGSVVSCTMYRNAASSFAVRHSGPRSSSGGAVGDSIKLSATSSGTPAAFITPRYTVLVTFSSAANADASSATGAEAGSGCAPPSRSALTKSTSLTPGTA